ncbi:MAG TPA: biotin transporter BioY [Bacillota bacterium]|nr:biotin transporter BioY [Bacillota bacterium]
MKFSPRDITRVSLFAALHVAAAVVLRYGGESVVPFSIVPFMAFLAAFVMGARQGAASLLIYSLMGIMGLPVFARPPFGGPAYVLQPTFGFLLGFIVAAFVAGNLKIDSLAGRVLAVCAGVLSLYVVGTIYFFAIFRLYLARPVSFAWVLQVAVAPFVVLDLIKAYLAATLALRLRRILRKSGLH